MDKNMCKWVTNCIACQKNKVTRHVKAPITNIPVPVQRFDQMHIDIVGPLTPSDGKMYLLTIIERTTLWFKSIPLEHTDAESCTTALISNWIARHGLPDSILTDRGSQFVSA